jgi:hypothetical protein
MARFQGLPIIGGPDIEPLIVCRVLAMLIRRNEKGMAERVALIDLPGDEWDTAPVLGAMATISLV